MSNSHRYGDNYVEEGVFRNPFFNTSVSEKYDIFSICCTENLERKRIAVNKGLYEKHTYHSRI
jgi:hypothetical protein